MESCVKGTELIMEEEEEETTVRSIKIKKTGSRAHYEKGNEVYQDYEYISNSCLWNSNMNSFDGDDEVFLDDTSSEHNVHKPRARRISDVIDSIGDGSPSKESHFFPDYLTVQSPPEYQTPVRRSVELSGSNSSNSVAAGTTISSISSPPITPNSDFGYISGSAGSGYTPPSMIHLMWTSGRACSDQMDVGADRTKWDDHTDAKPTNPPEQSSASGEHHSYHYSYKYNTTVEARMPVSRGSDQYNMTHRRRGLAVIFNNEEFRTEPTRRGSDHDVNALKNMYQLLGFEVEVHHNLDLDKLRETITSLTQQDYSDCDCLSITILTHGLESNYLHARDLPFRAEQLWQPFAADLCPTLAGKPKLFFIQACRGQGFDNGVRLVSRTQTDGAGGDSYKIPKMADFLIVFSTVEGFYSWRNPENGTWFIQSLCRVLSERFETTDLLKMMTIVCRAVAIDYESYNDVLVEQDKQKQVPSLYSTLIRDVYFTPKM